MKWYFAGRMRHQLQLRQLADFLKSKNQTILSEWLYLDSLKPYQENISEVQKLAKSITDSLLQADIFVLISDQEGTDMFVELGVCLSRSVTPNPCVIYIVGEYSKRSLMQLHPPIIHLKNIEELLKYENIEPGCFEFPLF